jgi:hypothetical protein
MEPELPPCKGCNKPSGPIRNSARIPLCSDCGSTGVNLKLTKYASKMLVILLQGEVSLDIIEFKESFLNGLQKSYPEFVDPGDGEH